MFTVTACRMLWINFGFGSLNIFLLFSTIFFFLFLTIFFRLYCPRTHLYPSLPQQRLFVICLNSHFPLQILAFETPPPPPTPQNFQNLQISMLKVSMDIDWNCTL